MKRWIAMILMLLLLTQVLPLEALASSGDVLSAEELAAAYALTGLGDQGSQARSNTYHKGMMPNEAWNAMQVSDWLEEMLGTNVFSVEDTLSRASVKLTKLAEEDIDGYNQFTDEDEYQGVIEYVQVMYREAESLREEMRWQQDRIREQAGLIAELGRKLTAGSDSLYASEKVRLSGQIKAAVKKLKAARAAVVSNAKDWTAVMDMMQNTLNPYYGGAAAPEFPAGQVGDWIDEILAYEGGLISNTAPVALVNDSGSRIRRLAVNGSVLSDANNATVHVMSENEIGLVFYTSDDKGGKKYLEGIRVTVQDTGVSGAEAQTYTSDVRGGVYISTNNFVVDEDKKVHFKLDVEAEDQGCRSLGVSQVEMVLGEVRQMPMVPLKDGEPYVYSASFDGEDIRYDDYEMMFTNLNDWNFEIEVKVRMPGGGKAPAPKLSYWTRGNSNWSYEQRWSKATSSDGNTYIFKNTWKRILAPELDTDQRPFIAFDMSDSAEHFYTRLISLKSVVDSPLEEGSDVFEDVLEEGLGFTFHIPVVDMDVSLNLPFKKYLPKFTVDLAGFATMSVGSEILADDLENSKIQWQSADMKELSDEQKNREKENGFSNYKAQYGVAYDKYKQQGWHFYGESKLEIGVFCVISARWEIDNSDENITRKIVKGRGAAGILVKYSYSWMIMHLIGPVPVYISFTLGINAGFALSLQVGFSWDGNSFHDWELKPLKDLTINIAFSFTAQAGAGIKDFLEVWLRFTATLSFRLTLMIMGEEPSSFVIGGELLLEAGVTVFWVEISKEWGPWGGTLYDSTANGNALPPLQKYVYENAQAPEQVEPAAQEPDSYPGLVPEAKTILSNEANAHSTIKVATSNGHTFAFYLDKVKDSETGSTRQRVCWVDVDTGKKDSDLDMLGYDAASHSWKMDDYAFDVWSDGNTVFILGCCADGFDENGYPVAGTLVSPHAYAYILTCTYDASADSLLIVSSIDFFPTERNACNLDAVLNPRGLTEPRIEWAGVTYDGGILSGVEVYGFAERVNSGSEETGYACFEYTGGKNFRLLSDKAIKSSMGDDYERVNLRAGVKGYSGNIDAKSGFRCFSFLAVTRPKDGKEGDSAIEMYDWEMNMAPVKYKTTVTKSKPVVVEVTLQETKRQAVALKKGDIGSFEMVQTVEAGSDAYDQMVFYTQAETNADGAKVYKLNGLHIGNKQGTLTRSLSYDVADYTYDVTMPSGAFSVQTVNGTPYIYWLSNAAGTSDSDPDVWRLWVCTYDPGTNSMSTPAVFSEFTLKSGIVPRDVLLTTDGRAYLTATPTPNDGDKKPQPMTLYSFPLTLQPELKMKGVIVEGVTVAAGDFQDATIVLMNEGNMGISSFDVQMYTLNGNQANVVETLHCDLLKPENSSLTMRGGTKAETLPKGTRAIFRNSDFDYTTRQRSWVLSESKQALKLTENTGEAWKSSLTRRDSSTNFVQTDMLMPGALASFTGTLKIPENWKGDKTIYLRVSKVSSYANWQGAMANAAGVQSSDGLTANSAVANAAAALELTWALNEAGDELVLQTDALAGNSTAARAVANAVKSGLLADTADSSDLVAVEHAIHDLDIAHRLYEDVDGTMMLDIVLHNYADTKDTFKLVCEVYLDGSDEPYYASLPYYEKVMAHRVTQTFTMPVETIVEKPEEHQRARIVLTAVDRDESAFINNEFTLHLNGASALRFTKQPRDTSVQEGENVAFEVEVTGGREPYSYQWQVFNPKTGKWVKLKGFTEATLSRKAVEKKWSGAKFRCVVTDARGQQIISDEATLTVRDKVPTGDSSSLPLYLSVALIAIALICFLHRRIRPAE